MMGPDDSSSLGESGAVSMGCAIELVRANETRLVPFSVSCVGTDDATLCGGLSMGRVIELVRDSETRLVTFFIFLLVFSRAKLTLSHFILSTEFDRCI